MSRLFKLSFMSLLVMGLFVTTGCDTKKKQKTETADPTPSVGSENTGGDNDTISNIELMADSDSGNAGPLETVYFDFNSSTLSSSARSALQSNAQFLKENESVEVRIEGHCDERGGVQYNLALGERRANSIKKYITALGVDGSRIETVTYGKERPIAFGHDEQAWSKNRRGNFVVTKK